MTRKVGGFAAHAFNAPSHLEKRAQPIEFGLNAWAGNPPTLRVCINRSVVF